MLDGGVPGRGQPPSTINNPSGLLIDDMPQFAYRAKDHDRRVIEGTIEAENESAAISRLGGEGVFPIAIIEVAAALPSSRKTFTRRISQQSLAYLTRQLADLLGGGLPLLSALTLLARQTEQPALRHVVESLADSVRDGQAFSEALAVHPQVFPSLYISMVKAGEIGGSLEPTLSRLADLGEHEADLRSRIISAAAYPLFVLAIAVGMTVFLMAYVIPKLSLVFVGEGQLLPLPTRFLLAVSRVFTDWWWIMLCGVVIAGWTLRRWYASPAGRALVDRSLMALPVMGTLVRKLEIARFARNLGTMVSQGVPILQALDVVANNVSNATLQASIHQLGGAVREGSSLAFALTATKQFPVFMSNMVAVGEESGTVDAALLKVATTYEREGDRLIRTLTTILEPVLLVGVGGVVMFIVLAMLLPIFQVGLVVQ